MKKLFLLLLLFPTFLFSQENMKKSAEDFIMEYFKLHEDLKWDAIPGMYAEDAQIVWPNGEVLNTMKEIKPYLEKINKETIGLKIDVKTMLVDVTGPNSVMVTTNFISTIKQKEIIHVFDQTDVYLLERVGDLWKIKKDVTNWNFPLIFSENVDEKYVLRSMPLIVRAKEAIDLVWSNISYGIEDFKKSGRPSAMYGKIMGKRYASFWDQSKGFNYSTLSLIKAFEVFFTQVEVMQRDETTLKARFTPPMINKNMNVTRKDLFNYSESFWFEIADKMGTSFTQTDDGKYWIVTIKKK